MKSISLYPIIASVMMLITTGNLKGQELDFTIKLNKESYKKGEPILCTLMLKNIGKKDLVINNRLLVNRPTGPHEVSMKLIGPDLKQVPFESKIRASFTTDKYIVLPPGSIEMKTYTLTEDFYLADKGDYTITAYYENTRNPAGSSFKQPAWMGTLTSNKVDFKLR